MVLQHGDLEGTLSLLPRGSLLAPYLVSSTVIETVLDNQRGWDMETLGFIPLMKSSSTQSR